MRYDQSYIETRRNVSNVAIITNFNINEKREAAIKVIGKLNSLGCKVTLPIKALERLQGISGLEGNVEYLAFDKFYKDIDAVIILGGDGSILEGARYASLNGVPVLGMNLGHLGYLAELEMDEIDALEKVVKGEYIVEERSMLKISLLSERKGKIHCGYALNDVIISNASAPKVIDLSLSENDTVIANYRGDGLIVATPTGSTAYSMSAGGAVVDPRLRCFCVTPICPHSFNSKPMILPDTAVLEMKNCSQREKYLIFTLDGRKSFELYFGDRVCVSKASTTAKFIRLKPAGFYMTLHKKMSANES